MSSFFSHSKAWSLHSLEQRLKGSAYSLLLLPIVLFLSIWHSQMTHTLSMDANTNISSLPVDLNDLFEKPHRAGATNFTITAGVSERRLHRRLRRSRRVCL